MVFLSRSIGAGTEMINLSCPGAEPVDSAAQGATVDGGAPVPFAVCASDQVDVTA